MDERELQALQSQIGKDGLQGQGIASGQGKEADEAKAAEAALKRDVLATVLDNGARERLSRIALVSPTRSSQIEAILLRMSQTGQLKGRVTEQQLIELLEQADESQGKSGSGKKKGTIVYQRRRDIDEDDFDF